MTHPQPSPQNPHTSQSARFSSFTLSPRELPLEFYRSGPWDDLDVAGFGSFLARLDISIFFLRKGANGRITVLAPPKGPNYSFSLLNDGTEEWTYDLVWETIREQTQDPLQGQIYPTAGGLLR